MAVGMIDIDVNVVRDVSKGLDEDAADIDDIISELEKIEEEIKEAWKSRYTGDYVQCITDTRIRLIKIRESVNNISQSLENTAQTVERTEQEVNNIFLTNGKGGQTP